jgi:hypothetical protein
LELVNIRAGVDTAMGKGIENHVASVKQQVEVYQEQLRVSEESRNALDAYIKRLDTLIAKDKKLLEKKKANNATKEEIKLIEARIAGNTALQNLSKEANKTAEAAEKSLFDTVIRSVDNFQNAMNRLAEMPEFRRVSAEIDLSGAMQEAAAFSDDWQNTMRQSVALAREASKERLEIQKKMIEKVYAANKEAMEREIELAGAAKKMKPEEIARAKAELARTLEANKQLEISRKVTEQKRVELDRAKAAAAYATEMVDMQQQVADAESQFLTEIGGNWQTILDLQSQSVQFEKQKADIAARLAEDLEARGIQGKELAQAQTAAKLAELRYQQKALGAQKNAYESLLGMAFGAIRSSAGVRKGLDTAAMKLGRAESRVKTRSGMFRAAGPGGPMTIEQRAVMGQLAGVAGGVAGAVPKKMTTEQLMEEAKKTADKNLAESEKTATATTGLYALGHVRKSIYTADTTTQDWLSKICDYAGQTVEALNQMYGYMSGSSAGKGMRKEEKKQGMEQKEATNEVAKVKEAIADSTKAQQGVESASKETAGKIADVNLSLADQLKLARAEFQAANQQLVEYQKNYGNSQQIKEATARTQEATQKVLKIQDQIRVNEMKNPMIGVGSSIEGMADILHGDVAQPMKETATSVSALTKEGKKATFEAGAPKKGKAKGGKDSEDVAATILASGKGMAGLSPGGGTVPDWNEYRYKVAGKKGEQLNKDSKDANEAVAAHMQSIEAMYNTPGSIYTHDIAVEQAIIGLGGIMESSFSRQAGGLETAPGQAIAGFAGMGEEAGAGAGGAMKVTGEIMVKFDSKMFKTQVTQIVGEVIRTGDIRKSLSQQGFANKVNGV